MKTSDRIKLLIKEGEGLSIEYKEHFTPRIAEDMVAFANTRGGTIILGVRDDRTVCGERLTSRMKADIHSLARNCDPAIEVTSISQQDEVVAVDIAEGTEKPYSCGSGYYRRLDAVTQKMNRRELKVMFAHGQGRTRGVGYVSH